MQKRICQNSKSTIAISVDLKSAMIISVELKSTMTIRVDLKSTMTIRADIKSTKTISVNIKSFHTQHRSTTVFLYPILVDHGLFIIRRLNWGNKKIRASCELCDYQCRWCFWLLACQMTHVWMWGCQLQCYLLRNRCRFHKEGGAVIVD